MTFYEAMAMEGRELDREISEMSEEDVEALLAEVEQAKRERGYQ